MDRKGSFIKTEFKNDPEAPRICEYKAVMDDKQKLISQKAYQHEKGFTPEKYLWMQLTSLLTKEKPVLMDYEDPSWRGVYLTGCYNVASGNVPFISLAGFSRQVILGGSSPVYEDGNYGMRSSVDIIQ